MTAVHNVIQKWQTIAYARTRSCSLAALAAVSARVTLANQIFPITIHCCSHARQTCAYTFEID